MDGLFGLLEGTLRISLTDATMMWIVHYAMDRAHGKVKSKDGVIQRLNEISKFYELAVIQLEGCMKFVQEDADNNMFESCHEKVLADLEEIKDRLQGRLQDSEMALREKDKELTERFENELKLRQALDAKEKELVALQNASVELERTKSDADAELSMSSPGSRDEDRDSEISELMHSVDQQVLHIEHEVIDEERNGGIDHTKIEQMGSDINILKETLHQAFGKMQNAIFLSELGPQERQWRWTIEKDAICTLINGFVNDFKENFEMEVRKQEKQVFMSLSEHLSDLMTEVTCLRNELESFINQNEAQLKASKGNENLQSSTKTNIESRIPPRPRRSLSEGDSCANFSSKVEEVESEEGDGQSVAKIIKSHESIIRRKFDEVKWLKREMFPEKGCSNLRREKDPVSLNRRIQEVIVRLDSLMNCNARLVETFGDYGGDQGDESSAAKILLKSDVRKETNSDIDSLDGVWKKMNNVSVADAANEELQIEIRMLKEEVESNKFEAQMREEIHYTVCSEAVKGFCSALDRKLEHFRDEFSLSEDICSVLYQEICKDWNEKIGNYIIDRLITEEVSRAVFDETIRDVVNTANYTFAKLQEVEVPDKSLEIAEFFVKENVYMVLFRETIDEWKKEIDACNIEYLFRQEIQEFVFREAMKDACQEEARKQDKSSSNNRDGSFEGNGEESFIEKLDMLLKCLEEDGDLMVSASSEVNEHKKQLDWVEMETGLLNEHEIFQELMNEDESTFTSVRSKLEKALDRLATSKTIMSELESSFGTADYGQERVDDQMIPADNVHDKNSITFQQQNEEIPRNQLDSMFTPILEFSQVFGNFELQAQEKLADKVLRLEEMKHQLDLLVELVSSIQKRELLYRTAFIRRSKNLQMAETEVDLLGDQVDAQIGLLHKIYTTLHQHSPVLQQHFEMSNDVFSQNSFILYLGLRDTEVDPERTNWRNSLSLSTNVGNPFTYNRDTVASLDSYESFKDRKYNLPPAIDEKEDAVNLSDKNFSDVLAKNQHVMVAFYAPWCFWSKKLAPEYEAAATELKGKAVLAKVNAINEIELAKRWGIQGYPTIYFFVNGVHVDTYYHDRKKDAIVNYIKTKMAGDLYTVMTTENAEHLLTAQSTIALGFLNSLKGLEGEVLVAASKLHPDVLFFQTTRADVAKMFLIDPEIKRPALVLLEKESKQLSHFDGPFTISVIDDFISSNKIPLMITYSRETTPLILNSPLKLLWLFAAVHDSEAKSIFQETARAFKGKGHTSRVIAVASIRKRKKYALNGELTLSNVKSFALDFLGDKLRNQQSKTALSQIQLQQKLLARLPVPDMMTKEAI
ncbi:WPP domain associated protein [Citrus sinensis]|uniref:WPP domain associated protein n=1 Tax=Citrus sinensis TaxID=2711 RepID=A0ACB8L4K5_CITSI|nr:WPP domain associated protein [Citrus sinensis]